MTLLFMLALMAVGVYFLKRRGRGEDQPTVAQDLKALFGFGPKRTPDSDSSQQSEISTARHPAVRNQDDHSIEEDPELTDADRIEEIMDLTDLWNLSENVGNEKKDSQ